MCLRKVRGVRSKRRGYDFGMLKFNTVHLEGPSPFKPPWDVLIGLHNGSN